MTQAAGEAVWQALLERTACRRAGAPDSKRAGHRAPAAALDGLYVSLVDAACAAPTVVAHLGQSLDGRIATTGGDSRYVTGPADAVHNHRLRALCDAVIVGAETIARDDPCLTVRYVAGDHPVRVVIDPERRLAGDFRVFGDGAAATLLICRSELCRGAGERHGAAEVVGVAADGNGALEPAAIVGALAARRLTALFIEGGGVTVSRFLAAGLLDRLQITVAPLLLGSGRPVLTLPEIARASDGLRPRVHRFDIGDDILFDCTFNG